MALSGGPMDRTALPERAYERLRAAIIDGELEPGSKLGVGETAVAFGTSRETVRAALERLTREGLVETYRNMFSRVPLMDTESTSNAVDVLEDVWTGAVRRFLPRAGDEEIAVLGDRTKQMAVAADSRDVTSFAEATEELAVCCSRDDASPDRTHIVQLTCAHVRRYWVLSDRAFDWVAAETFISTIRKAFQARDAAGACDAITRFLNVP